MSKNAERLVKKLKQLNITVHGVNWHIIRDKQTEILNQQAGEAAPTWELRADPLWETTSGRIIYNGRQPTVDIRGQRLESVEVYGFQPLTFILKTPLELWDVDLDEMERLLVFVNDFPESWGAP
jgi:hypothetical protein